ncbi:MAG: BBP7 family outer membrane beta-barrel protein [Planctomycetota bacterium]
MNKKLRGMTLAALMLSASASANAGENGVAHAGDIPQGFVGDSMTMPTKGAVPMRSAPVRNASANTYTPISVGDLRPVGFAGDCDSCTSCDGPSCDDFGCDSCGGKRNGLQSLLNLCDKDGWIRAEGMLMFHKNRVAPPLVSSSPSGTALGTSGVLPAANVEFGEELDGGLSGGFRADVGRYLSDYVGVGGRVLWVGENGDTYSASGDQTNGGDLQLGRPYFFIPTLNPGLAGEDAEIVSALGSFSGSVDAEFATDLVMAEAYARLTFCKNKSSRVEMIGGYTHASLDDMIRIMSVTGDINDPTLQTTEFSSLFETENRFNGGQIGFDSLITRGNWSVRALTKVHLGNVEQTVNIQGQTIDRLAGTVVGVQNSSLLVSEEQGVQTNDAFTFIPEMDFTLGYRFRDHVSFTVGYTFLYFDNVALAGQQINRFQDTDDLGANVTPVAFDIVEGSHWVQGISLGASIDF